MELATEMHKIFKIKELQNNIVPIYSLPGKNEAENV